MSAKEIIRHIEAGVLLVWEAGRRPEAILISPSVYRVIAQHMGKPSVNFLSVKTFKLAVFVNRWVPPDHIYIGGIELAELGLYTL